MSQKTLVANVLPAIFSTLAGILLTTLAASASAADLQQAIADGEVSLGLRLRVEQVDQDGVPEDALASTGRARMTWTSGEIGAFSLGIEADYAFVLGFDDFNSTTNDRTEYPVVADPEGFDLNQGFIRYRNGATTVTAGRQRINHGSQRMVGGVAWRQNEQTYDALRIQHTGKLNVDYAYVYNVNRIFGPDDGAQPGDWIANSHLLRAEFNPIPKHTFSAFAYLLDLENDNGPPNSNATYGLEYQGSFSRLTLTASAARQADWADNPITYDAPYYTVQGAFDLDAFTVTLAYESLGSDDGRYSFRTPLATLHKFQGWTDKFLITPAEGVEDSWFSITREFLGVVSVTAAYHNFEAAEGGADAGEEVGVSVMISPREDFGLQLKLARYHADDHASDTNKGWLVFNWNM